MISKNSYLCNLSGTYNLYSGLWSDLSDLSVINHILVLSNILKNRRYSNCSQLDPEYCGIWRRYLSNLIIYVVLKQKVSPLAENLTF